MGKVKTLYVIRQWETHGVRKVACKPSEDPNIFHYNGDKGFERVDLSKDIGIRVFDTRREAEDVVYQKAEKALRVLDKRCERLDKLLDDLDLRRKK